jgi:cell division protein FtsQ
LQEELYPSHAADAREEILPPHLDDARLLDLDVEEQSPFLRAQKRVSARRSSLPRKTANRLLWGLMAAGVVCLLGLGAAGIYHYGEHSWRFRVESSDNIEVAGMHNVSKAQIMEVMGADIGRNIFFIPLAQQKAQLEQIPWVEAASVMRFVPNRLAVQIHERTPVAFARVGPRMFLIDAGGTLMDLTPKHKYSFPVILGMNPGEPLSTRAPRMQAYMELVRELDSGGAHYSQDLSEVDISDLDDLRVRVNDPAGDVLVHLGSSGYLERYKIYVAHAQAWRQQFQKLESVDLRYDNQIIVNPDREPAAKTAVLAPVTHKTSGAARVKPAALLTRINPNDRAVPKPAFELSQKTLQPKPKVARQTAVRAKRKKTVAKAATTKTIASAKKPFSPPATRPASPQIASPVIAGQKQAGGQKPSPGIVKGQENSE